MASTNAASFLQQGRIHAWLVATRNSFRLRLQRRALAALNERQLKRIVVGAGATRYRGWTSTDRATLDLLDETTWMRFVKPGSLDAILAEHVWEHLTPEQAAQAARVCFKYLKPGAYLRIAVPDGFHPDPAYVNQVKPGGCGSGAEDHKVLYTHESLAAVFAAAGFRPQLYEYFDARGQFHFEAWSPADGMVTRSKRFDKRNRLGLAYTSIVLDAVRP